MTGILNFFMRGHALEKNFEIGRALWAASVVAGIVYTGVDLIANHRFDIQNFGLGIGTLMLAGGGGIAMKDVANKAQPATPGTSTETTKTTTTSTVEG